MKKRHFFRVAILVVFLVVLGYAGCGVGDKVKRDRLWSDIDLSLYQFISFSRDTKANPNNIHPAMTTDYWELRSNFDHKLIVSAGDKCSKASNPQACTTEFDALRADHGFGDTICHTPPCGGYIVSNQGSNNQVWNTVDKLKEFLGTIDSKEEAVLLAEGHGFFASDAVSLNNAYWGVAYASPPPSYNGGVREIDGEYELVVRKYISLCSPWRENRYLIRIKPSGDLIILREQINEHYDGQGC